MEAMKRVDLHGFDVRAAGLPQTIETFFSLSPSYIPEQGVAFTYLQQATHPFVVLRVHDKTEFQFS